MEGLMAEVLKVGLPARPNMLKVQKVQELHVELIGG